ncbi:MAG: hypothetical protein M1541_08345, partial [Acidobacteria bacterium]|nr:hypothetical protein [Acidobacteriota bacterium]
LVAGKEGAPVPLENARNCDFCSERVWAALERFNILQDRSVLQIPDCDCRSAWRHTLESTAHGSLEARLAQLDSPIAEWLQIREVVPC